MKHGDRSMYIARKCRCAPCRAANKEYMAAYKAKNADRVSAYGAARYQQKKDEIIARMHDYYRREKQKISERQKHPDSLALRAMHEQARRAKKAGCETEDVHPDVVLLRGDTCGICGKPVRGDFHIDHIYPLSRGGLHCYRNVQLAHPKCNEKKQARLPTIEELED